ncbi:MAG TPA: DUF4132 domain-containing protein [Dehalococcoidia bacterium]|nr:DUF4132 domain-containing protein [Dehalococcoidia bacterium]
MVTSEDAAQPSSDDGDALAAEADLLIDRLPEAAFAPQACAWRRLYDRDLYTDGFLPGPEGHAVLFADPGLRAEVARRALLRWGERGGAAVERAGSEAARVELTVLHRAGVGLLHTLPAVSAEMIEPFFGADWPVPSQDEYWLALLNLVERHDRVFGRSDSLFEAIRRVWDRIGQNVNGYHPGPAAFREALGEAPSLPRAVRAHIATLPEGESEAWRALLIHMSEAAQARPSRAWLREARALLDGVGEQVFAAQAIGWLALLEPPLAQILSPAHAQTVRGCAWVCSLTENAELARAVARAAEALHRKYAYATARSILAANACIYALGQMPGSEPAVQLLQLSRRLKDGNQRPAIERALAEATRRLGIARDELEEQTVSEVGFDDDGCLRREIGAFAAELAIAGSRPGEWRWRDASGRQYKSPPATLKAEHAEALKALRRERDELGKALTAQRDRIERLLLGERVLSAVAWRERYLDHPLVRHIARRLVWQVEANGHTETVIWHDEGLVNAQGEPVAWPGEGALVRLWHPLNTSPEVAAAWREWLEAHAVAQPFKQAHRELYLLTDAERATGAYSNRFAAHILRQHQFKRLCDERGWRYAMVTIYDAPLTTRATRALPGGGRVEFWIEAQGLDDGTASGVLLYCSTDQVRFCARRGGPLPLTEIRPLLFSEVMREVDLFVGVASIGNDPQWQDRGAGPLGQQYGVYWHEYAFGELNASALTRREVLARLLPRLKIAGRCTLEERYLLVRGELHTYRIHLGSGNILIEPDGRYLCIVPSARSRGADPAGGLALPFEGDGVLSIILSKAFLLAADTHISDPTILSQLRRA